MSNKPRVLLLVALSSVACTVRHTAPGIWLGGIDPHDPNGDELRAHSPTGMSCHDEKALTQYYVEARRAAARRQVDAWYAHRNEAPPRLELLDDIPKGSVQSSAGARARRGTMPSNLASFALLAPSQSTPRADLQHKLRPEPPAKELLAEVNGSSGSTLGESDYVQQDRDSVYLGVNGQLHIIGGRSRKPLPSLLVRGVVRKLLAYRGRVLVASSCEASAQYRCERHAETALTLVDVSHPERPKELAHWQFTGDLLDVKRVSSLAHIVLVEGSSLDPLVQAGLSEIDKDDPAFVGQSSTPEVVYAGVDAVIREDGIQSIPHTVANGVLRPACDRIVLTRTENSTAFATVVSLDLLAQEPKVHATTLPSGPGLACVSDKALYLTASSGSPFVELYAGRPTTMLHKFRLGAKPEDTSYAGSGVVPGELVDTHSIDEWQGTLRVFTRYDADIGERVKVNELSLLQPTPHGSLVRVGILRNWAKKSGLSATRFDRHRAYAAMTGEDAALLAFELHDPTMPEVLWALPVRGSEISQIHLAQGHHLLTLGRKRRAAGKNAAREGVVLDLYDVARRAGPKLTHREVMSGVDPTLEVFENEHTFNYLARAQLLAFPVSVCTPQYDYRFDDGFLFSGIQFFGVDPHQGFRRYGQLDYSATFYRDPINGQRFQRCGEFPTRTTRYENRTLVRGNELWLVSHFEITVWSAEEPRRILAKVATQP